MNIQIKVTYASGTVTEILIPLEEKTLTAVSYQGEDDKCQETPSKTQDELDAEYARYVKMDMVEATREKEEVEGKGRIGGMGERKERGVEEEKPDQEADLCQVPFETQTTCYYVPIKTLKDFISAYGIELIKHEFPIAKAWLATNPKKRKTHQGTGRFLNAWLSRAQSNAHFNKVKEAVTTGSLLSASTDSQEGW